MVHIPTGNHIDTEKSGRARSHTRPALTPRRVARHAATRAAHCSGNAMPFTRRRLTNKPHTSELYPQYAAVFRRLDADGSGELTLEEIRAALVNDEDFARLTGAPTTLNRFAATAVASHITDASDVEAIGLEEFCGWLVRCNAEAQSAILEKAAAATSSPAAAETAAPARVHVSPEAGSSRARGKSLFRRHGGKDNRADESRWQCASRPWPLPHRSSADGQLSVR